MIRRVVIFWLLNINVMSISCNLQPFSAGLEASLITVGIQKVSRGKSHRERNARYTRTVLKYDCHFKTPPKVSFLRHVFP